jgi:hypothetical protein
MAQAITEATSNSVIRAQSPQHVKLMDYTVGETRSVASVVADQVDKKSIAQGRVVPALRKRIGNPGIVSAQLLGVIGAGDSAKPHMGLTQQDFVAINQRCALSTPVGRSFAGFSFGREPMGQFEFGHDLNRSDD